MKFKFISNGVLYNGDLDYKVVVNPAYFFIRAYYLLHGKNPEMEWLPCEWFMDSSVEEQLEKIIDQKPDVIGFSLYVWNNDYQYDLIRKVKQALPNCVIVAGGPQLDAHKDPTYFEKYPFVDYVCYGDGEEAFQLLVDKLSGHSTADLVNMVENLKPGYKLWPYKMIEDQQYLNTSSYLIQQDLVLDTYKHLTRYVKSSDVEFGVEFARGCMYKCSFCDWAQNLSKKVKRRSYNWREEIDFFHKHDMQIRETDANFGQWPEDYDIFKYCLSLYDPNRNFKFHPRNYAKMKKDVVHKMMYDVVTTLNSHVKIALQDIHEDVLQNIDRPSIPWEKYKPMVKQLYDSLPDKDKYKMTTEIIIGLPGQTYQKVIDMVVDLHKSGIKKFIAYFWTYLVNAPAADKSYQEKYQLKWVDVFVPYNKRRYDNDTEQLIQSLVSDVPNPEHWVKHTTVSDHFTSDFKEIIKSHYFAVCFYEQFKNFVGIMTDEQLEWVVEEIKQHVEDSVESSYKILSSTKEKYGAVILGILHNGYWLNYWDSARKFTKNVPLVNLM